MPSARKSARVITPLPPAGSQATVSYNPPPTLNPLAFLSSDLLLQSDTLTAGPVYTGSTEEPFRQGNPASLSWLSAGKQSGQGQPRQIPSSALSLGLGIGNWWSEGKVGMGALLPCWPYSLEGAGEAAWVLPESFSQHHFCSLKDTCP